MYDIEAIKANVNIIDVVQRAGIKLNKKNSACCPFHTEKTPSFYINPQKQIFKCFGCGMGGDVISFVQAYYNIDFNATIKRLEDDYSLISADGVNLYLNQKSSLKRTSERLKRKKQKRHEIALIDYRRRLWLKIKSYNPPPEVADFSNEYLQATNEIDLIDYYCDIMAYGTGEQKEELIQNERVKTIERDYRQPRTE